MIHNQKASPLFSPTKKLKHWTSIKCELRLPSISNQWRPAGLLPIIRTLRPSIMAQPLSPSPRSNRSAQASSPKKPTISFWWVEQAPAKTGLRPFWAELLHWTNSKTPITPYRHCARNDADQQRQEGVRHLSGTGGVRCLTLQYPRSDQRPDPLPGRVYPKEMSREGGNRPRAMPGRSSGSSRPWTVV